MTKNIIEQLEEENGCRWDANDGDNPTMWGLLGMMGRALGKSSHDPKDDVVAGVLFSPQGQEHLKREAQTGQALLGLLGLGFSPEDIHNMNKR